MQTSIVSSSPATRLPTLLCSVSPRRLIMKPYATNEPIMNTSPWAKLISSMIP